jgi:thiamine pyrophosphate-dependent acetolactate synthase large subunit-like protein
MTGDSNRYGFLTTSTAQLVVMYFHLTFYQPSKYRYIAVHTFECHDLAHSIPLVVQSMKEMEQKTKVSVDEHKHHIHRKSRLSMFPTTKQDHVDDEFCHPGIFFQKMSMLLDDDAILCADIGDNALWMASGISAVKGQRTLTSEHMGIMGFALNAGLAASLSTSRQVLVVAGDGGVQMSINELATLKGQCHQSGMISIILLESPHLCTCNHRRSLMQECLSCDNPKRKTW